MNNMTLSILLNSGPFVFLGIRYSEYFAARRGVAKLVAFIATIFAANFLLLRDRYSIDESALRASSIAVAYLAMVFVMAAIRASGSTPKAPITAADTPSTPTDRAP